MSRLTNEFKELFTDVTKQTNAIQHDVDVGDAKPCKQYPYHVNSLRVQYMEKEIEYMLQNGIIETSSSEWNSPC